MLMEKTYTPKDLESWISGFTPDLLSWALHKISDRQVAEDLVQDTFLVAFEKIASFEGRSHPRTWLFGILNNKILEHYRGRIRARKIEPTDPQSLEEYFDVSGRWKSGQAPGAWFDDRENLLDDPEFTSVFEDCFGKLPDNWRACLSLRFLDSREPEQICQELGISVTNYWQIIHRAKLRMRSCLEMNWEDD